ncbi:hypothetical protein ACFQVC_32330 [Streptomyces monticola]|uniref:DUF2750 domain-containing protein n=1 Tax=Streptomyces monticola TaxID=2666263 RepID=A0ABW2JU80_9ACTN
MGYELQAAVAADELLRGASREVPGARVVPLRQGLSLMPMTDEVFDACADGSDGEALGFWKSPGSFETLLAQWSSTGPVAYGEAEYFGGVGEQRAAVWADGSLALGPLDKPENSRFSRALTPTSQGLRRLGVQKGLDEDEDEGEDEFEALGLDRHRSNEDWIASGTG